VIWNVLHLFYGDAAHERGPLDAELTLI
jgi:hypothetical protein